MNPKLLSNANPLDEFLLLLLTAGFAEFLAKLCGEATQIETQQKLLNSVGTIFDIESAVAIFRMLLASFFFSEKLANLHARCHPGSTTIIGSR